ncbi:TauD/TfdA dioxygenase family protein [Rhodococcus sp. O3]|uniref:TauD/TfdA dioxygenase family protein n=1 Tax=Rhodococcus sp. O3 TaxID=3404919 RepID=UPI003B67064B
MTLVDDRPNLVSSLSVAPIAGHIGAEISGVDLSSELPAETIAALRAALLKHKVLYFADQRLTHDEHIRLTSYFGKVTPSHPLETEKGAPGYPQILEVDSRLYAEKFGSRKVSYANWWHTDVTAVVNPPALSVLRAELVPDVGGDTHFTDLAAAYADLPGSLKHFVDGLRAEHRFGGRKPYYSATSTVAKAAAAGPTVSEHPVVRVHPETGEKLLFVNPGFTSRIIGLSPSQSDRILDLLFEQITDPAYTARIRWRKDSLAIWDNRATAHRAPSDLDHLDVDRVLYRTTVEGDIPVGPDGRPSAIVSGKEFRAG